jgi:hypothetical protein
VVCRVKTRYFEEYSCGQWEFERIARIRRKQQWKRVYQDLHISEGSIWGLSQVAVPRISINKRPHLVALRTIFLLSSLLWVSGKMRARAVLEKSSYNEETRRCRMAENLSPKGLESNAGTVEI